MSLACRGRGGGGGGIRRDKVGPCRETDKEVMAARRTDNGGRGGLTCATHAQASTHLGEVRLSVDKGLEN